MQECIEVSTGLKPVLIGERADAAAPAVAGSYTWGFQSIPLTDSLVTDQPAELRNVLISGTIQTCHNP